VGSDISRFMDGSASITLEELEREWPQWNEHERLDFCQFCSWLDGQDDFPNMLRFVMQHGDTSDWCGVAMSVAHRLPRDEAFELLVKALRDSQIGHAANIGQGIALTKHPEAESTLRRHLEAIWAHCALWEDANFTNWVAFEATTCIAHLIELGAAPGDFEWQVRQLRQHACAGNRNSCRNYLSKHYKWMT
jgi:hypothetical protein